MKITSVEALSRLVGTMAFTLAAAVAWAADPPAASNLVPSQDGTYVIDLRTKLAWTRCAEGMRWNGKTCTGEPLLLTHAEAIALAGARSKADGTNWRLPRVTELRRLLNKTGKPPGLDPMLFPAAPRDWCWAITANIDTAPVNQYEYGNIMRGRTNENANQMAFLHGWAVNMMTGEARGDVTKRSKLPVRLVRPQT